MPTVLASLAIAFAFFSFHLAHQDNAFFARWIPPTPETWYPNSPTAGKPEILAPCSGVSVLLTSKREVPGFTSGRFLTTRLSLPLAEITAAGLLVAAGPLNGAPELSAPCRSISHRDLLGGESLLGPVDFFDSVSIAVPQVMGI
jgi:hypothetical protein